MQDGQVYHHIIDPQTGYPSESDLTSVTIVCSDGTTADALNEATEHLMAAINALVKVDADTPSGSEDVGRILRTFKIKKNVEVTDNGKIII